MAKSGAAASAAAAAHGGEPAAQAGAGVGPGRAAAEENDEHDESAHSAEESERASSAPPGSDVNSWLPNVLSMLAKTQRDLVGKQNGGKGDHKRNLGTVRIEEFSGDKGTSAYAYRQW